MSERAKLPPDWEQQFNEITEPEDMRLLVPSTGDLIRDSRKTAAHLSESLLTRLSELEAYPNEYTFHDMPYDGGSVRVAITPPDGRYRGNVSSPVWRVIINQGRTIYHYTRPKEQWDLMDVLVQPASHRMSINTGQTTYTIGYGESAAPLETMLPRIIRDVDSNRYSLMHAPSYTHTLPEVPIISRNDRLAHYQSYVAQVGWLLQTIQPLSEATQVEAAPDLQRDEDT